jgi:triosephosphate isomerase
MRKPLIAANWKMNTTISEALTLVQQMLPELDTESNVETLFCPPFISISAIYELTKQSKVMLGAQNVYYEDKGAFTGEISPLMLVNLCQYVILGHSERRNLFGESNQIVNRKIKAAIKHDLKPILCVGENLVDNENGKTEAVVSQQLKESLEGLEKAEGLVIAYEPIWAIGTGRAASGTQANAIIGMIRSALAGIVGRETADITRILYGGSANGSNVTEFLGQSEIDGALVGGASLKAAEFVSMVKQTASIKG